MKMMTFGGESAARAVVNGLSALARARIREGYAFILMVLNLKDTG
jgi:hypothetical protein